MKIFCCGCEKEVEAELTTGESVYPNRKDLHALPFWRCNACNNYVGCHHKTKNRTAPLGAIPTPEIRAERQEIHKLIDPIWRSGRISRKQLYKKISALTGKKYHTANIRSMEEARKIRDAVLSIAPG